MIDADNDGFAAAAAFAGNKITFPTKKLVEAGYLYSVPLTRKNMLNEAQWRMCSGQGHIFYHWRFWNR